jgi:hypothetical protein
MKGGQLGDYVVGAASLSVGGSSFEPGAAGLPEADDQSPLRHGRGRTEVDSGNGGLLPCQSSHQTEQYKIHPIGRILVFC